MCVSSVRAGDVIICPQSVTYSYRNCLLPDGDVRNPRNLRTPVEFHDPFFKQSNRHHLAVHVREFLYANLSRGLRSFCLHVDISFLHEELVWYCSIRARVRKTAQFSRTPILDRPIANRNRMTENPVLNVRRRERNEHRELPPRKSVPDSSLITVHREVYIHEIEM